MKYRSFESLYCALRLHRMVLLLCVLLVISFNTSLAAQNDDALIKTAFIEKLTRFIDWPESTNANTRKDFQLCVVGNGQMLASIRQLAIATDIKEKHINVHKVIDIKNVQACNLIYFSTSRRVVVDEVLTQVQGKPILTISDAAGLAERGVIINFFEKDNKVRFEINLDAAKKAGFLISSRLLKVSRIVGKEGLQ